MADKTQVDQAENTIYIAHPAQTLEASQTLETHLFNVKTLAEGLAKRLNLQQSGALIGLLHDFGKYSEAFQAYIRKVSELADLDFDRDDDIEIPKRGSVNHSAAGAKYICQLAQEYAQTQPDMTKQVGQQYIVAATQALAVCVASHHSGLMDCSAIDKRIMSIDEQRIRSHFAECCDKADKSIKQAAYKLIDSGAINELALAFRQISERQGANQSAIQTAFYQGMLVKMLFSCLIDADRIDSARFAEPDKNAIRNQPEHIPDWSIAIDRLESTLALYAEANNADSKVNQLRAEVSLQCKIKAAMPQGSYLLSSPTGAGKTLASLRYALYHAKQHNLQRIFYIIPFTSIIEQNAEQIRQILEPAGEQGEWVLEHHSNLDPEQETWQAKITSENWDSPIIVTTMVQFLESLFGSGTKRARRMIALANSVMVFDEIQSLPLQCTQLFCNAINYLTEHAGATALMCTATQPLLNRVPDDIAQFGRLNLAENAELMAQIPDLFEQFERVKVIDKTRPELGYQPQEVADFATELSEKMGSCLVVVNTKFWALQVYELAKALFEDKGLDKDALFHLSTFQCAEHRSDSIKQIKTRLADDLPVLCISTALIECGVDISMKSGIRMLAGLPSIAQTAGRVNRSGEWDRGELYLMNAEPQTEKLTMLPEIEKGKDITTSLLRHFAGLDLTETEQIDFFFKQYFYDRREELRYLLDDKEQEGSLVSLLSSKTARVSRRRERARPLLSQAFQSAATQFKVIDAPTKALIVIYKNSEQLIAELAALDPRFQAKDIRHKLRQLQRFSVNCYEGVYKKLKDAGAIEAIDQGEGKDPIEYLRKPFYNQEFGVDITGQGEESFYGF